MTFIMATVQCTGVNIRLSTLRSAKYNKSVDSYVPGNLLYCPWADVALSLLPRDNTNPLHNITCVYQLASYPCVNYYM